MVGTHTRERLRAADELVDAIDASVVRRALG
jgi:hypothetical protein